MTPANPNTMQQSDAEKSPFAPFEGTREELAMKLNAVLRDLLTAGDLLHERWKAQSKPVARRLISYVPLIQRAMEELATPADMPASDAANVRKGFWDVYEPNNHKRIYVTVFNSAEAESYAENGYKVVEQVSAAPKECASAMTDERAAFEAWWNSSGKYYSKPKENCFRAWQARALLASQPSAQPTEQKPAVGISRDGSHFYLIRKRDDGSDWPTDTVFYATPQPSAPADVAAVRDAALEEATRKGFNAGICVALQHIRSMDCGTTWREIVTCVGVDEMLQYAAFEEPEEWELAGFSYYAKNELGRLKPRTNRALKSAAPTAHLDDTAVDLFASLMKSKLAAARDKGRHGWEYCEPAELSKMLREHVEKGDPVDVANFCMFLKSLNAPISDTRSIYIYERTVKAAPGK